MLPSRTLAGGRASRHELPKGPNGLPLCRWCDLEILAKRRRTFCSDYCVHQWRLRTDPGYLRDQVFARDRGRCAVCHIDTVAAYAALKRARGAASPFKRSVCSDCIDVTDGAAATVACEDLVAEIARVSAQTPLVDAVVAAEGTAAFGEDLEVAPTAQRQAIRTFWKLVT